MKFVLGRKNQTYLELMERLKNRTDESIDQLSQHMVYSNPVTRDKLAQGVLNTIAVCIDILNKAKLDGAYVSSYPQQHLSEEMGSGLVFINVFDLNEDIDDL